jgi:FkbM family methyltransferase
MALARRFIRSGSLAIDAGGHLGYFTLTLAGLVGPDGSVQSFECDPRLARRLREHVELNDCPWVTVNEVALSDGSNSELRLRLTDQLGWSTTKSEHWVEAAEEIKVPARSLDQHLEELGRDPGDLSFAKIDIEGAELDCLRGASSTLEASDAAVLVEFYPDRMRVLGDDPQDLLDLMGELGYRAWRVDGKRRLTFTEARASTSGDVLFVRGRP